MNLRSQENAASDPNDSDELDLNLLEKYDNKLRRQQYLKRMRQIYRNEEKQERFYLIEKVKELENELDRFLQQETMKKHAKTLLPWNEIAEELKNERYHAVLQKEELLSELDRYETLVRRMKIWVESNAVLKCSLDGCVTTWRDSCLLADPRSRQLGKEWILHHLYRNTHRMFQQHGFPSLEEPNDYHFFDLSYSDDLSCGVQYVLGGQFDIIPPIDSLSSLYCHQTCSVLMANFQQPVPFDTIKEDDGKTLLHRMITSTNEYVNVLTSYYQETNRFVAVVQDIIDDETIPFEDRSHLRRYRTYWVEITCLPTGQWKRRFLYMFSQRCGPNGPTPLEEEALMWGCYLKHVKPELRQARFRHDFMTMCSRVCAKGGFFHPNNAVHRRATKEKE